MPTKLLPGAAAMAPAEFGTHLLPLVRAGVVCSWIVCSRLAQPQRGSRGRPPDQRSRAAPQYNRRQSPSSAPAPSKPPVLFLRSIAALAEHPFPDSPILRPPLRDSVPKAHVPFHSQTHSVVARSEKGDDGAGEEAPHNTSTPYSSAPSSSREPGYSQDRKRADTARSIPALFASRRASWPAQCPSSISMSSGKISKPLRSESASIPSWVVAPG